MKYIGLKLILILAFLTLLNSCKEESSTNNDNDTTDPQILAISAKWNVSDNNSTYVAFEFNKYGNYIVSFDEYLDVEPRFGKYELVGGTTIKMADFGEILIVSVNENSFEFELTTYKNNYTESIRTLKQAEMELTTRTKLLCRTWELTGVSSDNPDIDPEELEEFEELNLTVLFSPAGTYFVRSKEKGDDYFNYFDKYWKWFDNKEQTLCYSSYFDYLDCDPDNQVTIPVLTSNYLEIHEDEIIFELAPYTGAFTNSMDLQKNPNEIDNNSNNPKTRTSKFPKGSFFFGY